MFRNVTIATSGEKEFPATVFSFPAQQRMIGKQLQGAGARSEAERELALDPVQR